MNEDRIELIQASGYQACIVVAGGGSGAVHAVLSQPGASRFVIDAQIPYSRAAMNAFLGMIPASYCAEETVRAMAREAYERAARFGAVRPLGISCTAALRTQGERGDADRAFLCFYASGRTHVEEVSISGGSRREQEQFLSERLLDKLADFIEE